LGGFFVSKKGLAVANPRGGEKS